MTCLRLRAARLSLVSCLSLLGLAVAPGCADPCVDDGLGQKSCPSAQEASGTAAEDTGGTMDAEAGSADADTDAEAGSADADTGDGDGDTMGDGDGDGDGDTAGDGDGDGDTGVPPECSNGMMDPGETDVDCGGICGNTCEDGDDCLENGDCINAMCVEEVCGDPVCNPEGYNGCQGCLQQQCCPSIIECMEDPACVCWFECIQHNNDFMPCKESCMVGNVGTITSCANSACNYEGACGL